MRALVTGLCLLASGAGAEDWRALTGPEIREALETRVVRYKDAQQDFRSSGRTLYRTRDDSWGYWDVKKDQYCSQWPPVTDWACYDMAISADGTMVRWIAFDGGVTDGKYVDLRVD